MKLSDSIKYVGVNDKRIDLFEGQYPVPDGISYNSYVIRDEKTAVIDSVDTNFGEQWLQNIAQVLDGEKPDYIIVQHMEPDHSANIGLFAKTYPEAVIVASDMAFVMMKNFFKTDFSERCLAVKDGDTLNLGEHTLTFFTAPMVHWPEVIMTYDSFTKTLFSADAFGKFGLPSASDYWAAEARRYYFGIVGKYGMQVQNLLKKLGNTEINSICPLHGPVLCDDINYYVGMYKKWSAYTPESDGVLIAYTSVYGNTREAVRLLADELEKQGCADIMLCDLARCDMTKAVAYAFYYRNTVLATTTYNGDIFPFMKTFIHALLERGFKNRRVGIIENGSWFPSAAGIIKEMLKDSEDIAFCDSVVTLRSTADEQNRDEIINLVKQLKKSS